MIEIEISEHTIGWGYRWSPCDVASISYVRARSSLASQPFSVVGQATLRWTSALARNESIRYFVDSRRMPDTIRKSSWPLSPNDLSNTKVVNDYGG